MEEQWGLSICLLHAMFGGECQDYEMLSLQGWTQAEAGNITTSTVAYDVSELNGYTDPYDTELFEDATQIFQRSLARYGVEASTCRACMR
mmetsp:Transcript_85586/g.215846  ORF Transcript_85586/g.215846 Transcript_85586/m.215846 type:complete len:90 (+) Transcript_85586:2-271(+)